MQGSRRAFVWLTGLLVVGFGLGVASTLVGGRRSTLPPTSTLMIQPSATVSPTLTPSATSSATAGPTLAPSATPTSPATPTPTAPPEESLTASPSATPDYPVGVVSLQTYCHYGPSSAYLPVWVLYPGLAVTAVAQDASGQWVLLQPADFAARCWAPVAGLALNGEPNELPLAELRLPRSDLYRAPTGLQVERDGSRLLVTWEPVFRATDDDRGYLLEGWLCRGGELVFTPLQTDLTQVTLTDEAGCTEPSTARLYTAEIHGYSVPVTVSLPPAGEP